VDCGHFAGNSRGCEWLSLRGGGKDIELCPTSFTCLQKTRDLGVI